MEYHSCSTIDCSLLHSTWGKGGYHFHSYCRWVSTSRGVPLPLFWAYLDSTWVTGSYLECILRWSFYLPLRAYHHHDHSTVLAFLGTCGAPFSGGDYRYHFLQPAVTVHCYRYRYHLPPPAGTTVLGGLEAGWIPACHPPAGTTCHLCLGAVLPLPPLPGMGLHRYTSCCSAWAGGVPPPAGGSTCHLGWVLPFVLGPPRSTVF